MNDDRDNQPGKSGFASPPCYAADIAPEYFDPMAVDPEQARDVARWRKAERARLRAERLALSLAQRQKVGEAIARHLRITIQKRFGGATGMVLSAYWPIKGEPDLRPLMADLHRSGVVIVLPLVETRAAPLTFRHWTPDTKMVRGDWNIPVPSSDSPEMTPDLMLAPLVGWTSTGYRLGYGGGYFDRTLAASNPRPHTMGIGYDMAQLETIFPQPHDIPLDIILTDKGERSVYARD